MLKSPVQLLCVAALISLASGGFLKCLVVNEFIKYAKNGASKVFDPTCVKEITFLIAPLVNNCENGDIGELVEEIAEQLCYEACEDVVAKYGSADWIKMDFLPPYGPVYIDCVKSTGVAMQKDIDNQCNAHVHGTPAQFCDQVFCQLYDALAKAVEAKEGCPAKTVC